MNEFAGPTLSVIIPAYNEEAGIEAAVREVQVEVLSRFPDAELIVVNDGSRDGTGSVLDLLAETDSRLRVIHQPNGGHGRAVRAGLDAARGEWILLIDSDRQIPLSAFAPMWNEARAKHGAFGVRRRRDDPRLRLILTAAIRRLMIPLFKVSLHDANVPFKIMRRDLWEEARPHIPIDTLAPSLFLAIYLRRRGYAIAELDVPHRERTTGTVSIRRLKLLKFCARAFRQLLAFRRSLNKMDAPDGRAVVWERAEPARNDDRHI